MGNILLIGVWTSDKTLRHAFGTLILGVSISEKTSLLIKVISILGVWRSDKMLPLLLGILLPGVWIRDETLLLVFDVLLLSVIRISDETVHVVLGIVNCEIRRWLQLISNKILT